MEPLAMTKTVNEIDTPQKTDIDSVEKLAWTVPEFKVISLAETETGTAFIVPAMEGSFYSPS